MSKIEGRRNGIDLDPQEQFNTLARLRIVYESQLYRPIEIKHKPDVKKKTLRQRGAKLFKNLKGLKGLKHGLCVM
jgi:hypothetical protein